MHKCVHECVLCVCVYRCSDPSLQPIVGSVWGGCRAGRVLLHLAQPGVSGVCWPRLRIPLRSSRLWGLQGEWPDITHTHVRKACTIHTHINICLHNHTPGQSALQHMFYNKDTGVDALLVNYFCACWRAAQGLCVLSLSLEDREDLNLPPEGH